MKMRQFLADDEAENSIMQTITIAVSAILIAAGLVTAPGLINNARNNNATNDLANLAYAQEYALANHGQYYANVKSGETDSLFDAVKADGDLSASFKYTLADKVSNQHAIVCNVGGQHEYLLSDVSQNGTKFYRSSANGTTSSKLSDIKVPSCISDQDAYYTEIGSSKITFGPNFNLGTATEQSATSKSLAVNAPASDPATLSLASGSIPAGTSISSANGTVVGTPTVTGTYNFTIKAVNKAQTVTSPQYTLVVTALPSFVSTYNTTLANCAAITVPISNLHGTVRVDWGDGSAVQTVTSDIPSHTYTATSANQQIKVTGLFDNYGRYQNTFVPTSAKCLTGVTSWGETGTTDARYAFSGTTNLTTLPGSLPSTVNNLNNVLSSSNYNGTAPSTWNVSKVGDFASAFSNSKFTQNISSWDTSAGKLFGSMFSGTTFNQPIGVWNMSAATDISSMFYNDAVFNQNVNAWDTSNVTTMAGTFGVASSFNQPLDNWKTLKVNTMSGMFRGTPFNQNINNWDVRLVQNMDSTFSDTTAYNQPLDQWKTDSLNSISSTFQNTKAFNQNISSWNTTNVTYAPNTFYGATAFNQPLNGWNVTNLNYATSMFAGATKFNQPLDQWRLNNATNLYDMFDGATAFNGSVTGWGVPKLQNAGSMFSSATAFNQPLTGWNTGNVTDMSSMFIRASKFNQDISGLNTAKVTNMSYEFYGASAFSQDLSGWNVAKVTSHDSFNANAPLFTKIPKFIS
jgi:surface protein